MESVSPGQNTDITRRIEEAIAKEVAPYVESHRGHIRFEKFEDGIVYVRLGGACEGCSAVSITLKAGVERMLRKQFREVDAVRQST